MKKIIVYTKDLKETLETLERNTEKKRAKYTDLFHQARKENNQSRQKGFHQRGYAL